MKGRGRSLAALLPALLLTLVLFTGCWSRQEINELAVIVAHGIDYEDGPEPYRVTLQVVRVGARARGAEAPGGRVGPPVTVITGTGHTPREAIGRLQRGTPRRFHTQHSEVWVLGERMARQGIAPLMDLFERDKMVRPSMLVLVARGSAREVLQHGQDMEPDLAATLRGILHDRTDGAGGLRVTVNELGMAMLRPGRQGVLPVVTVDHEAVDQGDAMVKVQGMALLKDDRLVGWLTEAETMGFLLVHGELRGTLTIPCPDEPGRSVSLDLLRGSSEVRPELVGGRPVVHVLARVESEVSVQACQRNLATPAAFANLEQAASQRLQERVRATLTRAQGLHTDVVGFGERFHRHLPHYWDQVVRRWDDELFPTLQPDLTVVVQIRRHGLTTAPIRRHPDIDEGGH